MNKNIYNYFYTGIIFLFLFLIIILFLKMTNFPFFPENFSNLEFLFQILNIIVGGGILFGIYKWKIDRILKEEDDFIKYFDELYLKSRVLLREDNLDKLTKNDYTPYLIESFNSLSFKIENDKIIINCILNIEDDNHIIANNMLGYEKIKDDLILSEALLDFYELINFLLINKNNLKSTKIKSYINLKLDLFRNIKFFFGLCILHIIYSKITNSNIGLTKIDNEISLIVNNTKIFDYINNLQHKFNILEKYL